MVVFMILICLLLLISYYQSVSPDKKKPNYPNHPYKHDVNSPNFNPFFPYEALYNAQKDAQSKEKEAQGAKEQLLLRFLYTLLFIFSIIAFLTYF